MGDAERIMEMPRTQSYHEPRGPYYIFVFHYGSPPISVPARCGPRTETGTIISVSVPGTTSIHRMSL